MEKDKNYLRIITLSINIELKMKQKIIYISLIVRDYDEAIEYYTKKLNFNLIEDTKLTDAKRWVVVSPPGSSGTSILLAKASTPEQKNFIGNQTGGRVFLFLHTDNFLEDYNKLKSNGVKFLENPREEEYGTVAVFEDLYGNRWDLLQLRDSLDK